MNRPTYTLELLLATLLGPVSASAAGEDVTKPFPDPASLPLQASMPDPLVMLDGTRITTKEGWLNRRRPELKALFQHYMYGAIPPRPERFEAKITAHYDDLFGGKATMKIVTISTGSSGSPRIDLLVIVPKKRPGPAPAFVAMNFCGNHAVIADPRVPLTRGWLYGSCKGCVDGRATEEARGSQAADWAVEATIDRGYALATFSSTDVDSDRKDVSDGIYAWLAKESKNEKLAEPASRGTISAWAWGFHRAVDYLVTDGDIDARRIAAVGHSRNGKTALLAAAFDERIALAIPHQAGCGGSAPSRGKIGESVQRINEGFPHWFNAEFKKFNGEPERLPFDQHCLVALCAPRPVLFSRSRTSGRTRAGSLKSSRPPIRSIASSARAASKPRSCRRPASFRTGSSATTSAKERTP